MRISSFISFTGFLMIIVATFSPIIHFAIFHQTMYQLSKPYGITFLLIAVVGIIGTVFNNPKLTRLISGIALALTVVLFIAAIFKIRSSFSFIPIHAVSGYLSGKVKFAWGWYLLCIGSILAVAGTLGKKKGYFNADI